MEWLRIVGAVLACMVLIAVLKQYSPVYAILAGLACCGLLLAYIVALAAPVLDYLAQLTGQLSGQDVSCVVRAVGIAIVAQIARDICKDAGQGALAGQVELAGRVLILLVALPLFQQLLQIIAGILA